MDAFFAYIKDHLSFTFSSYVLNELFICDICKLYHMNCLSAGCINKIWLKTHFLCFFFFSFPKWPTYLWHMWILWHELSICKVYQQNLINEPFSLFFSAYVIDELFICDKGILCQNVCNLMRGILCHKCM